MDVTNAVFYTSPSYPLKVVGTAAGQLGKHGGSGDFLGLLGQGEEGIGTLVVLFRAQKSMQGRKPLSFFAMMKCEAAWEVKGQM